MAPRTGFPLNCRTPPLLGANEHHTNMFSFFFYSEPVRREYAHLTRIHTAPTEYLHYSTIIQEEYAAWKLQTPIKKKQQAKFQVLQISAAKKQRTGAFDRQSKVGVTATASPQCQSPVEQPWRRACAAGLTDSRAPRASRSTRGTTRPARRSAQQEYCDMLHNARDSTEKLAPVAHQHVSAPGEGACCAR